MKKRYEKPMVLFEDFTMSMNIAANCNIKVTSSVENSCTDETLIMPGPGNGYVIFVSETTGCTWYEVDGEFNNICYDVPTGANVLFNS